MLNDKENYGVVIDCDPDLIGDIYSYYNEDLPDAEGKVKEYFNLYANKGISDICICVFCQNSTTPTKHWTWMGDKYLQKTENGYDVDYSSDPSFYGTITTKAAYEFFNTYNCDPYKVIFRTAKENGVNAWLSFRMNDKHYPFQATAFLRSEYFYECMGTEKMLHNHPFYCYHNAYNYGHLEVAQKMLDYIKEQVERYDFYGLQLDFMREIFCLDYLNDKDSCKKMTEFIKNVRAILDEREKQVGHPLKLMVRLTRDPDESKIFGFDAEEWIKLGLVDIIVPSSRVTATDDDMQIEKWKKLTEGTNVKIYACQEDSCLYFRRQNIETTKGFGKQYLDAGADKLYFSNYFHINFCSWDKEERKYEKERLYEIWDACSSYEKVSNGDRRCVMTYQEADVTPIGVNPYTPLPREIYSNDTVALRTGYIPENTELRVFIGIHSWYNKSLPKLYVDGYECELLGKSQDSYATSVNSHDFTDMYEYRVKLGKTDGTYRKVRFETDLVVPLNYFEIKIKG